MEKDKLDCNSAELTSSFAIFYLQTLKNKRTGWFVEKAED